MKKLFITSIVLFFLLPLTNGQNEPNNDDDLPAPTTGGGAATPPDAATTSSVNPSSGNDGGTQGTQTPDTEPPNAKCNTLTVTSVPTLAATCTGFTFTGALVATSNVVSCAGQNCKISDASVCCARSTTDEGAVSATTITDKVQMGVHCLNFVQNVKVTVIQIVIVKVN